VLHLGRLLNLVVVAKSDLDRVRNFARESEWRPGGVELRRTVRSATSLSDRRSVE